MEEENIINELISENRNDFDEITSRSNVIFEELSNKIASTDIQKETTQSTNDSEQKENDENVNTTATTQSSGDQKVTRPCQFAISRIKTIMKLDPELALASKESVFLICKATELFVDYVSKEAYKFTSQGMRKTLQKKDIDSAVNSVDSLCFLDAALD